MPDRLNTPPAAPRRNRAWLRERSGRFLVGLILIVLGIANIYPFLWMISTSLKSTSEASRHLELPIPISKFYSGENANDFVLDELADLNARQLKILAILQNRYAGDGTTPPTVTTPQYRTQTTAPTDVAPRELAALVERGYLIAEGDQDTYRLATDATGELIAGYNARQLLLLQTMWDENQTRLQAIEAPRPYSVTLDEYIETTSLYHAVDREQAGSQQKVEALAEQDLTELLGADLLYASRIQAINYWTVFRDMKFYVKVLTSLMLTAGVVFLSLTLTSMLGYALARLKFPGKVWVLMLLLAAAVAPREAVIIPIFRMLQGLELLDGLWGMVLWLSGVSIGNALLMAGFFLTLPKEVEEAASIDGAGPFRTFFDIALPMARPIVMTIGLFAFLSAWNDFLIPFLTTQAKPNMQPLAVAVYSIQQERAGYWELTNAAAAIMIIPVVILFLLLQKHIVNSIAVGAVKG